MNDNSIPDVTSKRQAMHRTMCLANRPWQYPDACSVHEAVEHTQHIGKTTSGRSTNEPQSYQVISSGFRSIRICQQGPPRGRSVNLLICSTGSCSDDRVLMLNKGESSKDFYSNIWLSRSGVQSSERRKYQRTLGTDSWRNRVILQSENVA